MTKPYMTNTLALMLAATLAGCAQFSAINPQKVAISDTSAGHYFIQQALDNGWFAHISRCENGATSVEVIAEPRFIAQLDRGAFCKQAGGTWANGSCVARGKLIYMTAPDDKSQQIYRLLQQGSQQSYQQWLVAAQSFGFKQDTINKG